MPRSSLKDVLERVRVVLLASRYVASEFQDRKQSDAMVDEAIQAIDEALEAKGASDAP